MKHIKSEEILRLYNEGVNCLQITQKLKVDKLTVKKVLSEYGIDYTSTRLKQREEKLKQIPLLYAQGYNQIYLEKHLNLTRKTIREVLKASDVEYRDKSKAFTLAKGHYINDNAFDDLTDPDVLYFIGLIYTDGHVTIDSKNKENSVQIKLQTQDFELLEKLKLFLKCNYTIRKTKDEESYSLRFYSKRICSVFKDLGFTSNKTYNLIPDERLKHSRDFWRGCVDGDGCLHFSKNENNTNKPVWIINLVGTKDTCQGFLDFVSENGIEHSRNIIKKPESKTLYSAVFSGRIGEQVVDFLYNNAKTYMERKYKKYLEYKEFYS